MRKSVLKTVCGMICRAVLGVTTALILSACVQPVNITIFLADDTVQEFVDKNQERVYIIDGSDPDLVAGNGKISGLDPDKYYMIEEFDEDANYRTFHFVTADGRRDRDLINIGKVTGGEVTGLTNFHHYRVRAATPLAAPVTYYDLATPPPPFTGGAPFPSTPLPAPKNDYYITIPLINTFDIVEVPISPAGANTDASGNFIELRGEKTITDYVFHFHYESAGDKDEFYFLKVTILERPSVNITVSFEINDAGASLVFSENNIQIPQSALLPGSLPYNIHISSSMPGINLEATRWSYNDHPEQTGATFTFNDSTIYGVDFLVPGRHYIGVTVFVNNVPYSRILTIEVL